MTAPWRGPADASASGPASLASADIAALARVICGKGGWIHADGTFLGVNGSDGFPNYHANTAGFLAGIDRPVGEVDCAWASPRVTTIAG